jgi:predicted Zn-dependent protease
MESSQESLFEQAMARYQAGASAAEILPDFLRITEAAPRQSAGWTCLAWLQLLCDLPEDALRSARFAVKLNPQDPQARVNLSLALLETESKGVREHVQVVQQVLTMAPQISDDLRTALDDGLQRRPNWTSLEKVKTWLNL